MYSITKRLDGTLYCVCRLQDDKVETVVPDIEAGVKWMKEAAWTCNHAKIKRKDIAFRQEVQRVLTTTEPMR